MEEDTQRDETPAERQQRWQIWKTTCICDVVTGGMPVRRYGCPLHPDDWADEMADRMRGIAERNG